MRIMKQPTFAVKRFPVSTEEIQKEDSYGPHLVDIHSAQQILNRLPDNRPKSIIHYFYSSINKCFFVSVAETGNPINIGKLAFKNNRTVSPKHFKKIYRLYKKHFLTVGKKHFEREDARELHLTFTWLINFFVLPIRDILRLNSHLVFAVDIEIDKKSYFVELSHLFNLRYRYSDGVEGEDILVTNVTGYTINQYIESLASLPFPEISSMNLLFGIKAEDPESLVDLKEKTRANAFNTIRELVKRKGGKVDDFESVEQLVSLCKKGMENNIIQVISHFFTSGKFEYLTTVSGSIRFDKIIEEISKLKDKGLLRDDIILDAKTCLNFDAFKPLYEHGIKLIYFSRIDLEANLIAFLLYELYSWHNAKRLGIKIPYLDGKSYLHEAWANVFRTLYRLMVMGETPEIP